ncbi:type II toxin-antitoxin system RelE family toxin [Fusobacterium ulcerans]|uniref:type II toxin-antitoxin system RelE family toxin n=1 Tax=Fusobacterium ulcerans TaxID=861 RepID=UPI001D0A0661|nr:type II toxin-antitoxin system mRNA interferase toxin, RelE/StbE family [Fusobacterium ulcerans]MCB8564521.1 type II toxin-antitoxin system mRNA interferase toxin, RelE/StbE family [Fusobacterium ulcerans]MCB8648692.1 type II toxin-antitoxin system mRNA interferase toxin, RelE/StbE family [Fusobacterium ulcerans]
MEIEYRYTKQVFKFFIKHQEVENKFKENIKAVLRGDNNIDIKMLKGMKDIMRMRIQDYRVIYKVENGDIVIIDVVMAGNRGEIYKKLK